MSERTFEPMTKAEVIAAQRAWAKYVTDQDVERLLALYDFGTPDEPLLFKPTLTDVMALSGLATIEMAMKDLGYPIELGSGVAAAQEYYRSTSGLAHSEAA